MRVHACVCVFVHFKPKGILFRLKCARVFHIYSWFFLLLFTFHGVFSVCHVHRHFAPNSNMYITIHFVLSILKLNCEYRNFWLGSITFVLLFFFVEKAKKIASIRLTSFFEHFSFVCCEILCEIKTPLTNLLLHAITLWSENENARHFSSHSHFLNDPFAVDW